MLKENGVCLVLSSRKSIDCIADCLSQTDTEKAFWGSIEDNGIIQKYEIGKYWMTEQQLPIAMEEHGFADVSTDFTVVSLTPDNPACPGGMAEDIINSQRHGAIEAILSTHSEKTDEVIDAVNAKYDLRLDLLRDGKKQWDTYTTVTMVLRGVKK